MLLSFSMTSSKYLLVDLSVSHFNEPNPQPESAAVGRVTAISPFSKRVRLLCMLFGCWVEKAHEFCTGS